MALQIQIALTEITADIITVDHGAISIKHAFNHLF